MDTATHRINFDQPAGRATIGPATIERWKLAIVLVGFIVVGIEWGRIFAEARGDFRQHWVLGRNLLDGRFEYEGHGKWGEPMDYPYPPFWGLAHVPLAFLPMHFAQVLLFPLFLGSLFLLIRILRRMTEPHWLLGATANFGCVTAALFLASRFLIRDMRECGVNLALVALSYLGIWLWSQRRTWMGGTVLGLAIALKCTPALFAVYFAWKREWKMVLATALAALSFTLSPVLLLGPTRFDTAFKFWVGHVLRGVSETDPSVGILGEERLDNHALGSSLARFLTHLPPNHPGRPERPLHFDALDLSPTTAGWLVKGIMLFSLGLVFWPLRHSVADRSDPRLVWEYATVSLAILLYSPITWGQHCVGTLPVLYLIVRETIVSRRIDRLACGCLVLYVLMALVLNADLVGKQIGELLLSCHLITAALLALVVVASRRGRRWIAAVELQSASTGQSSPYIWNGALVAECDSSDVIRFEQSRAACDESLIRV